MESDRKPSLFDVRPQAAEVNNFSTPHVHPGRVRCSTPCFQKPIEFARPLDVVVLLYSVQHKNQTGAREDTLGFHNPDHPGGNQSLKHHLDGREETDWPVGTRNSGRACMERRP